MIFFDLGFLFIVLLSALSHHFANLLSWQGNFLINGFVVCTHSAVSCEGTRGPVSVAIKYRILIVTAVSLLIETVSPVPQLALPALAKEQPSESFKPLYVGDFYGSSRRTQVQIVDDGPVKHDYRSAPPDPAGFEKTSLPSSQKHLDVQSPVIQAKSEEKKPIPAGQTIHEVARPAAFGSPMTKAEKQMWQKSRSSVSARASHVKANAADIFVSPRGDFPIPRLNFPRHDRPVASPDGK